MARSARKRFGQHFLEPAWVAKLVDIIDPKPGDTFIEIGPGRGALTRPLAERAGRVIAYEIDRDLAADLRATMPANVTVVEGDFLDQPPPATSRETSDLHVAANLPYNVASPILFKLVDWSRHGVRLGDATVMLQREVADRLAAAPGSRDYGVLSVLLRHRAAVERLLTLPPGAFRPAPKVQSAVVRLRFHAPDPPVADEAAFERVVKQAFSRRRKTLGNALFGGRVSAGPGGPIAANPKEIDAFRGRVTLQRAGIDPRRRAETLSISEFARLADQLRNNT
jgi:16S rRNA (adenine1518-N6/adenine1519-N6)-dimethyltransferase